MSGRAEIERAGVYAPAVFPPVVAGIVRWTMMQYVDQGRPQDAVRIAQDVIEHAEKAGWSITEGKIGFLQAVRR